MIKVKKYKDEFGNQIELEFSKDEILNINYGGNLDLYISYISKIDLNEFNCSITPEDYDLYNIFDKLYNSITEYRPFNDEYVDDKFKYYDERRAYPLVKDKVISFHSDDDPVGKGSMLEISKEDDKINISIKNGPEIEGFEIHGIRIRTDGCRYGSFYVPFMTMYNDINKTDFDVHQITMDEYVKSLKLKR